MLAPLYPVFGIRASDTLYPALGRELPVKYHHDNLGGTVNVIARRYNYDGRVMRMDIDMDMHMKRRHECRHRCSLCDDSVYVQNRLYARGVSRVRASCTGPPALGPQFSFA